MNAWLKPRLEIAHAIPTSAAQLLRVIFSCQVCWRTMRWHNGRTRCSPNPNPEEVFRDCVTNGERSAAHSILARSYCSNEGRMHLRRPTCYFHFSLAGRRRTIHSVLPTSTKVTVKRKARVLWARSGERALHRSGVLRCARVPLGWWSLRPCRTGHPFAVSGSGEPSPMIEFVFSASPETIRNEPPECRPSPSRQSAGPGSLRVPESRCVLLFHS